MLGLRLVHPKYAPIVFPHQLFFGIVRQLVKHPQNVCFLALKPNTMACNSKN